MGEWHELLNWIPIFTTALFGWLAVHYYARYRFTRTLLREVLFIFYKLELRDVWMTDQERDIINMAVDLTNKINK